MNYKCSDCDGTVSTRIKQNRWITLKCKCKITIIYFDGCITTKSKEQYLEFKKKMLGANNV